ncbi:PREDICTED: uncharacterized protein LOC108366518 [Rhagoletis zephyria]|uniref:uncharacterized protein LOC108366518 n=1 Tax=Rhagoletis zephyria TaxID=28612 RepID=UPI00081156E9|nr:PREDICTED: uncharacterized protein LOC108366518 [Rhagoletis zephyria]
MSLQTSAGEESINVRAPQDQLSISKATQLRWQQLEETMRLKEEYLKEKFRILSVEAGDESNVGDIGVPQASGTVVADNVHIASNATSASIEIDNQQVDGVYSAQRDFSNFSISNMQSAKHTSHQRTLNNEYNITSMQLASRQCVPRDLPTFNGDPDEWHIFISAYEQSSALAGFSNHENLIRLQKCLRGKAREVVRNLLELPDMVPNIINTLTTLKVREGKWQEPVAVKTRLGWTVFGGSSAAIPKKTLISLDEQRAIDILRSGEMRDNRYVARLLWSNDSVNLPDSLPTAIRRFKCLQRKITKDPELTHTIQQQIDNLVHKNYAVKLPADAIKDRGGKIWYVPIFIVRNPNKPNKVRLVWDAAAKSGEVSLNSFLIKGPDLLIPLLNILFNFRMGAVAVCGDIAEMFHRIQLQEAYADAQRFIWRDTGELLFSVHRLNVLSFGACCSPCIAHYVRDLNAYEHAAENSIAANAIKNHHYVDDFIDSTATVNEAIDLAKGVRDIHAKGGFFMHNWTSNSPEVLAALQQEGEITDKIFASNTDPVHVQKVLGMYWDPHIDNFKFVLKFARLQGNVFCEGTVPTKREVLQILMSVFDPLGLVACLTSYLKILVQDIWRSGLDWDQPLTAELASKWRVWTSYLPLIRTISVPRCYSPDLRREDCKVQLHTFVDASENALAAVSYFRIEYNSKFTTCLVAAKTKVAPLRPLSIPRLELQAALIGARLANMVVNSHKMHFEKRFIWSDSKTVLHWLQGDPRRYQQYVMFRIAEIQETTIPNEWRWVPTNLNVADIATKPKPCHEVSQQWIHGPAFLKQADSEWPEIVHLGTTNTDEIRPRFLYHNVINFNINFEYFSSWVRLYTAVANWILYIEKLKKSALSSSLSTHHFAQAKQFIYKHAQMQGFDDWAALKEGKPVSKHGPLRNLQVYMDGFGLIRVKNRAKYFVSQEQHDFIVLPQHHHVTELVAAHYHQRFHHVQHETALNESEVFANLFWKRWVREMLPTFTRRSKWFTRVKPIAKDDVVLIVDENAERNTWLKGIVVDITLAKDGQVRRAKVKTIHGILDRPAVKLAVLDIAKKEASSDESAAYRGKNVADKTNYVE